MARGAGLLAGRALRGGWGFLAGLALVVALGGGASIGAAVAAYRTDHAYGDYVEDSDVSELVVNPSVASPEMDEAIRSFDGVDSVHADTLLFGSFLLTKPVKLADGLASAAEENWVQVRGSLDGRYVDVDRPAVTEGRLPSGDDEIFVSTDFHAELERLLDRRLDVGDTVDIGFFWAGIFESDPDPEEVVAPIGVDTLTISGFGTLPNEVLPEELYPRQQVVVSSNVANQYHCLQDLTGATTREEAFAAAFPKECSSQYDYYSLSIPRGTEAVRSIRKQFDATVEQLNEGLSPQLSEIGIGYYYISQDRSDLDAAVRETVRPTVTTLRAFAVVAAIATLTVIGLMMARQSQRAADVQRNLRALGATRPQVASWTAAPALLAVAGGTVAALAVAYALSPVGPLGSVRHLAGTSLSLPATVAVPAAVALLAASAVVVALVCARSAWRATGRPSPSRIGRIRRLAGRGRPAVSSGVGAALDSRRAGAGIAAMVGCVVATAAAATALVFGASLTDLVDDPQAYAWPWDVMVITGAGYGDTDPAVVADRLSQPDVADDVEGFSNYSVDPAAVIGDRPVPTVFAWANALDTDLPVLEGRRPAAPDEALLGQTTAKRLHVQVGESTTVTSLEFGKREVKVVGIGVLPSMGAFVADRTGLGTGAFVLIDAVAKEASEASSPAFTGIRLRDGADAAAVLARLEPDLASWSILDEPPVTHDDPVRSPEIENVSELRLAPLLLGGALLASLMLGLWLAVTLSVRDRRRELAVLRAVGFGERDVRRSVRWQGLTLIGVGLLIGLPLGIIGGRYAWRYFADRLGVVPTVTIPVTWLVVEALATLLLGWLAVALPARTAAHLAPAQELLVP
jgi:hypothetical protein